MGDKTTLSGLRGLVSRYMENCQYKNAAFLASKLNAMGGGKNDEDVFLQANAYFHDGQFRRALQSLRESTERKIPKHCQLAARCMIACDETEEALDFLNTIVPDEKAVEDLIGDDEELACVASSICVLKARVLELLETRKKASVWYKIALRHDIHCFEAYDALVEKHMLFEADERSFLNEISKNQNTWLIHWYQARMLKYDETHGTAHDRFDVLERKWNLRESSDLIAAKAEQLYCSNKIREAYDLSMKLKEIDPVLYNASPVSILTLFDLNKKSELFYLAHQLADTNPKRPESWFAVGCYYLLIRKNSTAQSYFEKATSVDPHFAPAWIGYGNAFAAQDESDQAMAAYRTASRLFPGCHVPLLYIAMEYLRTNNNNMAMQCIRQARQVCSSDPLIFNELGVVCYNEGKYESAIQAFRHAVELCTDNAEAVLVNLGHSYRKIRNYSEAVECYQRASVLDPRNASTLVALGFTNHLRGKIDTAIEIYHKALAMKPNHSFASEMLSRALKTSLEISTVDTIPMRIIRQDDAQEESKSSFVSSSYIEGETDQSNMMVESSFDDDMDMDY